MIISNPVLVVDTSMWVHHVVPQELLDGGVVSIIIGLYKNWNGKQWVLHDNCKRQLDIVVADGRLVLQSYYYYYPETDPIKEADWYLTAMQPYPVKFAWEDAENHDHPMTSLFRAEQYRRFMLELNTHFSKSGVYTNKSFVDGFAPNMNSWLCLYPSWVAEYGHQPATATLLSWQTVNRMWLPDYDIELADGQKPELVQGHQFTGDVMMVPGIYDNGMTQNAILHMNRMTDDISQFRAEFIQTIKTGILSTATVQPNTQVPASQVSEYPKHTLLKSVNPNVHETSDPSSKVFGYLVSANYPEVYVDDANQVTGYSHIQPIGQFKDGGWIKTVYMQ